MSVGVPDNAICLECGYALRGLPEPRCPECGLAFDPNDPDSFGPLAGPRWMRHWRASPQVWHVVLVITATLLSSLPHSLLLSPPYGHFSSQKIENAPYELLDWLAQLAKPFLGLVCIDYLLRMRACGSVQTLQPGSSRGSPVSRSSQWRWWVTPICCVLLLSMPLYPWPRIMRFQLSRPAFERVMIAYRQNPQAVTAPRWVGLYYVRYIYSYGPGHAAFGIDYVRGDTWGIVYDRAAAQRGVLGDLGWGWYVKSW